MSLKIGINLTRYYSINFSLPKRGKNLIKFIILHYTGMKKESSAIKKLCDSKSKVSSHYFIKYNGQVLNLVPDLYKAWHAGKSSWGKFKSLNKYSIGIEIHNPGHQHGYKKFTSKQIFSLIKLLNYLTKKFKIKKENILGHSDISPNRKKDPGEKFPWRELAKKKFCIWHKLNEKKLKKNRSIKIKDYEEKLFLNNLRIIGYAKVNKHGFKKNKVALIKAFQRKFRQKFINGKADKECFLIAKSLVKL
tara:strand:- start:124 stop:867 length:744 start_codon:yes stop_codon:yes gene_type:complete